MTGDSLLRVLQAIGVGRSAATVDVESGAKALASEIRTALATDPTRLELLLGAWLELAAARLHDVCLVATGEGWGPGVRSVDQAMLELVLAAKRSIHLTIFSVTGGADALLGAVATRMHEEASMECWCLFDAPEAGPLSWAAPPSLARLAQGYPDRFHLFAVSLPQGNLHAKVLVADRSRVVLGSANLTLAGLQRSHELGVILAGPVAWDLAQRIETLSCARFSWQRVGGKQPND